MITEADIHPNEIALRLTARDYISWSAITTFQGCGLRYYWRYVEGRPEDTVSASLVFGGAIHRAIELHLRERLAG
jgi:putative RecB family exonuclease